MTRKRPIELLFLILLIGVTLSITALVSAQDDDPPEPLPAQPEPASPAGIDWSQAVMPEHSPAPSVSQPPAQPDTAAAPPASAPGSQYIVQPGDTLFRIASRFHMAVAALAAVNHLANPSLIKAGQALTIPAAESTAAPPAAAPPAAASEYVVQRGDTLSRIAGRFGVTVQALAAANQIRNANLIYVGLGLVIPGGETAVPETAPAPVEKEPAAAGAYTVQRGDSLSRIARRFGITIQALANANNINNWSLIFPGQQLRIPGADSQPPSPAPADNSPFIWPVESRRIVKYFQAGHPAIDLVVDTGTAVHAIADGTVEYAGWNEYGYGNLVVIDHGNGWRTLYAHHSSLIVKTGQVVKQGETIGLSGSTGNSSMPHLHLEIMADFGHVNPCRELPGGC